MFKHAQSHRIASFFSVALAALFLAGCAGVPVRDARAQIMTGRVLSKAEVCQLAPRVYVGDNVYAEVNSAGLARVYDEFHNELFRLGVTKWNQRFDCNRFAELFTGVAQTMFFRESFHQRTPAQALALGPFWYVRGDGRGAHAIIQVLTERGIIYLEPQTGEHVTLTPAERTSAFLQVM